MSIRMRNGIAISTLTMLFGLALFFALYLEHEVDAGVSQVSGQRARSSAALPSSISPRAKNLPSEAPISSESNGVSTNETPQDPAWSDPFTGPILRKAMSVDPEKVAAETSAAQQALLSELARVASQPMEATFEEVISSGPNSTIRTLMLKSPKAIINDYSRRPPWSGIMRAAESGTGEEKTALVKLIRDYYENTFENLPDSAPDGEDLGPTKLMPGGAEIFPVILGTLDSDGEHFSLLVDVVNELHEVSAHEMAKAFPGRVYDRVLPDTTEYLALYGALEALENLDASALGGTSSEVAVKLEAFRNGYLPILNEHEMHRDAFMFVDVVPALTDLARSIAEFKQGVKSQ